VIKSQALADFVAEWTNPELEEAAQNPEHWLMFYDGAKCKNGVGAGVVLVSPEGDAMRYAIQIDFTNPTPTNNIAEYDGLLTGLRIAISLGI
jgi:ribonuclease HI